MRETGRLHWAELSRAGRISIAGIAASAALAIALGLVIPRIAEHHVLESRLDAMRSLVRVLESERLVPSIGDHLTGDAYRRFDDIVRGGLLGGDNLRVKLWNPHGEIVYSDDRRLVGRRFPIGPNLEGAFADAPSVEISDLSDEENVLDRALGDRLLEFYIPLHGQGGVVGAFEIYQAFDPLAAHLTAIRTAVWIAVGSGLLVLLVFLILLFSATARAMERDQRAAVDRAEDLAVLLQTSQTLSSEPGITQTGPAVLRTLTDRLGLRCAAFALDGSEPWLIVAGGGQPGVCSLGLAAAREARETDAAVARTGRADRTLGHAVAGSTCSVLAVPFRVEPNLSGTLVACRDAERPLEPREQALVSGVAGQLGVAAESARLFGDLQQMTEARGQLLRRLVDAQEEERRHLVGDLHDGAGQILTRVLYGLRGSRARLDPGNKEVAGELARLETLVDELIVNFRRYLAAIQPAMVQDLGLPEALEAFAGAQEEEAGFQIDVRADGLPPLDPATAITLYRAAQEAVINARKHADARRLSIVLGREDGAVCLRVHDDGSGSQQIRDGIGLTYMKDRVASLGGTVDVASRPGQGTTVTVRVPVES